MQNTTQPIIFCGLNRLTCWIQLVLPSLPGLVRMTRPTLSLFALPSSRLGACGSVNMAYFTSTNPPEPIESMLSIRADFIPHDYLTRSASRVSILRLVYRPSYTHHQNGRCSINFKTYTPSNILSLIHDLSRILPLIYVLIRSPT